MILFSILLGIIFFFILQQQRAVLPTAFPAVIMSFGIVNVGVFHLPEHTTNWTYIFFHISTSLATAFFCQQIWLVRVNRWKETHFAAPQQAVTFGTWVAGGVILSLQWMYLYNFLLVSTVLFVVLGISWILYLLHVGISAFRQQHSRTRANGTYLLLTVSTQSLVIFANHVFQVSDFWNKALLMTGVIFYIGSVFFLFPSIQRSTWNGTYCILHGALSITGVATLTAGVLDENLLLPFWSIVTSLFIGIELLEISRFTSRQSFIASLQPNITNWSRLFTFGMFYTFTFSMSFPQGFLSTIAEVVILVLPFVLVPLIVKEIIASGIAFFTKKKVFTESS
ncbi:hypothetical protein [Paenisporosarcina cavernae]|uniref:Uncharacterized protein n=1 Tax=Paenisporosarcina cavernae TaxID=2320858 RepID=A0A385YYL0_9BACL|nr:hypothetical protein [Paenisporosarcina cavernae]AYC30653.1 hypothetical protein D3873_12770 [Paenisporosarcina cavernae]